MEKMVLLFGKSSVFQKSQLKVWLLNHNPIMCLVHSLLYYFNCIALGSLPKHLLALILFFCFFVFRQGLESLPFLSGRRTRGSWSHHKTHLAWHLKPEPTSSLFFSYFVGYMSPNTHFTSASDKVWRTEDVDLFAKISGCRDSRHETTVLVQSLWLPLLTHLADYNFHE